MIFDWGHGSRLDPVDFVFVARLVKHLRRAIHRLLPRGTVAEQFGPLFLRPSGELVVAEFENVDISVVLLDELVESSEVVEAGFELPHGINSKTIVDHVGHKLEIH